MKPIRALVIALLIATSTLWFPRTSCRRFCDNAICRSTTQNLRPEFTNTVVMPRNRGRRPGYSHLLRLAAGFKKGNGIGRRNKGPKTSVRILKITVRSRWTGVDAPGWHRKIAAPFKTVHGALRNHDGRRLQFQQFRELLWIGYRRFAGEIFADVSG